MTTNSTRNVLYIMHLPPPVHGASMVGEYIKESKFLQSKFEGNYINMSSATNLKNIGKFGFGKVTNYLKMLYNIKKTIKAEYPDVVYMTPNSAGISFYKDFLTVTLVKHWIGYPFFELKLPCKLKCRGRNKRNNREDRKSRILVHYHNKGVKEFSKTKLNDWLYRHFFKDLHVLLLGEILYDDIKKYVPISKVWTCGNGLPKLPDNTEELIAQNVKRKCEDSTRRPLHILFLSNMMEEKGVWTLIGACDIMKKNGVVYKCTFVGGWKDVTESMFRKKIDDSCLQNEVEAVGPKYGEEKDPYWLDADVFVFPTYYHNECFPLVLLEAMQHALPCISTNEGAISNIIDEGETGYVVNARNAGHLAAKIMELADDKDKRINMGLNGYRKYKKQYTLEVFENRLYNVLEQLM